MNDKEKTTLDPVENAQEMLNDTKNEVDRILQSMLENAAALLASIVSGTKENVADAVDSVLQGALLDPEQSVKVVDPLRTALNLAILTQFFALLSDSDILYLKTAQNENSSDYIKSLHASCSIPKKHKSVTSEFLSSVNNIQAGNPPFMGTNYAQALLALESLEDVSSKRPDLWNDPTIPIKRIAVLIFFSVYPDIKITAPASLTPDQLENIRTGFHQFNDYVEANGAPGKEYETFLRFFGLEPASATAEGAVKKEYRTKRKAGATTETPRYIATPTLPAYQYSLSLFQSGNAYLQPISNADNLTFKNGALYFNDIPVSMAQLENMKTKERIQTIDLPLLRTFYSIILSDFEANRQELSDVLTLYVPDFAEKIGLGRNINKQDVNLLVKKAQTFHNVVGVIRSNQYGATRESIFPVLNFEGYDAQSNTISFSSPYMNHVIEEVYGASVRRDKRGAPRLKANGDPLRISSHSYLVKSEIYKERNKAAVENVIILIAMIEQAGNNTPKIKASTLIERNPQLQDRLENAKDKKSLLKRTFAKTWELLQTMTRLQEVYKDIQLPDPKNPASIPTPARLNDTVFTFPHKGKKNNENKQSSSTSQS